MRGERFLLLFVLVQLVKDCASNHTTSCATSSSLRSALPLTRPLSAHTRPRQSVWRGRQAPPRPQLLRAPLRAPRAPSACVVVNKTAYLEQQQLHLNITELQLQLQEQQKEAYFRLPKKAQWAPALPKARPISGRRLVAEMNDEDKKKVLLEWMKAFEEPCPLPPDVLESVHKLMTEGGILSQADLVGADEQEVAALWTGSLLNVKAYLRRMVRFKNRVEEKEPVFEKPAKQEIIRFAGSEVNTAELQDTFGKEGSAESVAAALRGGAAEKSKEDLSVQDLLAAAQLGLAGLQHHMQVDHTLWLQVMADTESARQKGRQPMTYIDLTSPKLLPTWLPPAAIGAVNTAAAELSPSAPTNELQSLSAALRGALATPRAFRSIAQWQAAFMRFSVLALAVGQWTLPQIISYVAMLMQLAEEERSRGASPLIITIYDALSRIEWAQRCLRCDQTFDLEVATSVIDERLLAAAKTRFELLSTGKRGQPDYSAAESAMARSAGAAASIQQRAQQAAAKLAAEANKAQRARASMQATEDTQGKGRGRKARRSDWFANRKMPKKGGGKGG